MNNGFYHEQPTNQDIYVAPHMVKEVGATSFNGEVEHAGHGTGTCQHNGKEYAVALRHQGADRYWEIVYRRQ